MTLAGLGTPRPLRPIGDTDLELVPIGHGERVTARAYWGDRLAQADTINGDSAYFVAVLAASGVSLVLPSRLKNPIHGGTREEMPVDDVVMTTAMWVQRDATEWYGVEAYPVLADGPIALATAGLTAWAVVTVAGTISGDATPLGIHRLAVPGPFQTGAGLRGWILGTQAAEVG